MRQIKNPTFASENCDCVVTQTLRNSTENESPIRALNSMFVVDFLYQVGHRPDNAVKRPRGTADRTGIPTRGIGRQLLYRAIRVSLNKARADGLKRADVKSIHEQACEINAAIRQIN
jgi:hypothetical protein